MILIIYDNKNRDFSTSVELAKKILKNKKDSKICIINLFELDDALYFLKNINVILLPFFRIQSKNQILKIVKKNISIVVYDTEGANGIDGLGVKQSLIKSKKLIKYVDKYLFWGSEQKKKCEKLFNDKSKIENVGYARFTEPKNYNKIYDFLICSNFALTNPKYNSKKSEYLLVKKNKVYGQDLLKFYNLMKIREKNFYITVKNIIEDNPNKRFILRPHPYENIENALAISNVYKNCSISLNKNSNYIIKKSKFLLHIDCITSLEAKILKIPSISLSWLVTNKKFCYKILLENSFQCKSYKQLDNIIKNKNSKKMKKYISKNKLFEKYFGSKNSDTLNKISKILINFNYKKKPFNKNIFTLNNLLKIYFRFLLPRPFFLFIYKYLRPIRYLSYKEKTSNIKNEFLKNFKLKYKIKFIGNMIIINNES